jgi:hypothetical protein
VPPKRSPTAQHQPLVGIGFKVLSIGFFLTMSTLLKASGDTPPGQLVFFRSFFGIVPIVVFLAFRRELIEASRPRGRSGICGAASSVSAAWASDSSR